MRRLLSLLLGLFLLAAFATAAGSPALAVDNGQIGIRPSNEPDYFHLTLAPGAATEGTAVISNHTGKPTTLTTYAVDGLTTPQGGFGFAAQSDPRKNVGAWAKLTATEVTVAADSEVLLPFRLTVPASATPGDYYGGLVIQSAPVAGKTVVAQQGTAVQLSIVQRQAVRIYLTVPGTRENRLQNGAVKWDASGETVRFSLPLRNTGNTILHPVATLRIDSAVGAKGNLRFNTPESLLPGQAITLHATLRDAAPVQVGTATADQRSEAGTKRLGTDFTYVPWWLLVSAVAAAVLLAIGGCRLVGFLRRARRALALTEGVSR